MWNYYLPVIIVVCSNTLYHICSKATPKDANMYLSLVITYLVAAASCAALYFYTRQSSCLSHDVGNINWSSYVLGLSIVFLEAGFIRMYRVGWNISIGSLVTNIGLAVALIILGVIFYHERISVNQIIGAALCVTGLIFINR